MGGRREGRRGGVLIVQYAKPLLLCVCIKNMKSHKSQEGLYRGRDCVLQECNILGQACVTKVITVHMTTHV